MGPVKTMKELFEEKIDDSLSEFLDFQEEMTKKEGEIDALIKVIEKQQQRILDLTTKCKKGE